MKFILARKLEMTQIWKGDNMVPVTKVQAGPCVVTQVKSKEKDGYEAVQIGFGIRKEKNIKKPQKGHMKMLGSFQFLREFRVDNLRPKDPKPELSVGDKMSADAFAEGDVVKVTGISKGKGFQGVVRRHGFHGHNTTHGTKDQVRMGGSVGATAPAHVFKGLRMPGHMGDDQVTIHNLEIAQVDKKTGVIYIKGAVPGSRNGLLMISGKGEMVKFVEEVVEEAEEIKEAVVEEVVEEAARETAEKDSDQIANEPEGAKEVKEEIAKAEAGETEVKTEEAAGQSEKADESAGKAEEENKAKDN